MRRKAKTYGRGGKPTATTTETPYALTIPLATRKAYHEAAHAVFALRHEMLHEVGLTLQRPAEDAPENAGGGAAVEMAPPSAPRGTEEMRQDIEVLLAATLTEMLLLHKAPDRSTAVDTLNLLVHAANDLRTVFAILSVYHAGNESAVDGDFRRIMAALSPRVLQSWDEIEAVAKVAMKKGKLSKSEIAVIVETIRDSK